MLLVVLVLLVGAGSFFLIRLNRDARVVDSGVVEFKKGNYEEAVRILGPYADRGNDAAELNMGMAYAFGLGVPKDSQRARKLLKAAEPGMAAAMYLWVAQSFETGDEVKKDPDEALIWYRIAAEEGSAEAKGWLAKSQAADVSTRKE